MRLKSPLVASVVISFLVCSFLINDFLDNSSKMNRQAFNMAAIMVKIPTFKDLVAETKSVIGLYHIGL